MSVSTPLAGSFEAQEADDFIGHNALGYTKSWFHVVEFVRIVLAELFRYGDDGRLLKNTLRREGRLAKDFAAVLVGRAEVAYRAPKDVAMDDRIPHSVNEKVRREACKILADTDQEVLMEMTRKGMGYLAFSFITRQDLLAKLALDQSLGDQIRSDATTLVTDPEKLKVLMKDSDRAVALVAAVTACKLPHRCRSCDGAGAIPTIPGTAFLCMSCKGSGKDDAVGRPDFERLFTGLVRLEGIEVVTIRCEFDSDPSPVKYEDFLKGVMPRCTA